MGAHAAKDRAKARSGNHMLGAATGVVAFLCVISFAAAFAVAASTTANAMRTVDERTPGTGTIAEGAATTTTEPAATTTVAETTAPPSTAAPAPTTTAPLPGDPEVALLQRRLIELGYDPGVMNGKYNDKIMHAIRAFQKVNDLKRTSKPDPDTLTALGKPKVPVPAQKREGLHVEASIPQQYLVVWNGDTLVRILPISTGAGGRWKTPTGEFTFIYRISGKHQSKLGFLWDPVYFDPGGFAVHGEPAVPVYPASHGCIRIPMYESEWFYDTVPLGTPLLVSPDPLPTRQT